MKIMQKVDSFLFKSCDEVKKSPHYQKITDINSSIDEESRPIISLLATLLMFLFPISLCLIFFIDNQGLHSEIETKDLIYKEVSKFSELKKRAAPLLNQLVANPKINSQGDFSSQIKGVAGTILPTKIMIENFSKRDTSDGLVVVNATIKLNAINNEDLALFIQNLSIQKKVQFLETEIDKSSSTDLLTAQIEVMQFSR